MTKSTPYEQTSPPDNISFRYKCDETRGRGGPDFGTRHFSKLELSIRFNLVRLKQSCCSISVYPPEAHNPSNSILTPADPASITLATRSGQRTLKRGRRTSQGAVARSAAVSRQRARRGSAARPSGPPPPRAAAVDSPPDGSSSGGARGGPANDATSANGCSTVSSAATDDVTASPAACGNDVESSGSSHPRLLIQVLGAE